MKGRLLSTHSSPLPFLHRITTHKMSDPFASQDIHDIWATAASSDDFPQPDPHTGAVIPNTTDEKVSNKVDISFSNHIFWNKIETVNQQCQSKIHLSPGNAINCVSMANLDVKDHRDLLDALAHPRAFAEGYKVPLKSDVVLLGASLLVEPTFWFESRWIWKESLIMEDRSWCQRNRRLRRSLVIWRPGKSLVISLRTIAGILNPL